MIAGVAHFYASEWLTFMLTFIPIEEKKIYVWIEHARYLNSLAESLPNTNFVFVCDREADFHELYKEIETFNNNFFFVIRAQHNRTLYNEEGEKELMFDKVSSSKEKGTFKVLIPRQSSTEKKKGHSERCTYFFAKSIDVDLQKESDLSKGIKPIHLSLVYAYEKDKPADDDQAYWYILTNMKADNLSAIINVVKIYKLRWRIEDLHKILKSTCKVEDFQYKTADRLMRAIAISLVVAWRILYISCLSKINTEIRAKKVFTKQQINLLMRIAWKNKKKDPINLRLAIHLIASFGGYEERYKDEPGYLSIGYGLVKFIGCLNLLSEC